MCLCHTAARDPSRRTSVKFADDAEAGTDDAVAEAAPEPKGSDRSASGGGGGAEGGGSPVAEVPAPNDATLPAELAVDAAERRASQAEQALEELGMYVWHTCRVVAGVKFADAVLVCDCVRAANDPVKVSEVARINEERLARLQAIETSDENDPLEDMVGHFLAAAVR